MLEKFLAESSACVPFRAGNDLHEIIWIVKAVDDEKIIVRRAVT